MISEFMDLDYAKTTIVDCNMLDVFVATTGHAGGDAGHGGVTVIRIEDVGSTYMEIVVNEQMCTPEESGNSLEIRLKGDSELDTIILALRFAADNLERIREYKKD